MTVEEIHLYPLLPENLEQYLPGDDCGKCTGKTCNQQAKLIVQRKGSATECPKLSKRLAGTIDAVAGLDIRLAESDPMMTKSGERLVEINAPGEDAPILVTADSSITVPILKRIFAVTEIKAFLVPVESGGYTLDNAVEERMFTAMAVMKALMDSGASGRSSQRTIVIPGLARPLDKTIERATRYQVKVGPVSGFELPIFLAAMEE
jgi:CO dehydrogenase/acetyl-CoA synthase gamma subunit (corrinoid Fe-S protein)